jgi:hypothetical protein
MPSPGADDASEPGVQSRERFEMIRKPDVVGVEERKQWRIGESDRSASRSGGARVSLEGDDNHGQQAFPTPGERSGLVVGMIVADHHGRGEHGLPRHRCQGGTERPRRVVRRDHDGDATGARLPLRLRRHRAKGTRRNPPWVATALSMISTRERP